MFPNSIDPSDLDVVRITLEIFDNTPLLEPLYLTLIAKLYTIEPRKVFFEVISKGLLFSLSAAASIAKISSVNLAYLDTESASPAVAPLYFAKSFPTLTAPSTNISPATTPLMLSMSFLINDLDTVGETLFNISWFACSPPNPNNLPITPLTPRSEDVIVLLIDPLFLLSLFSIVLKILSFE